MSRHLFSFVSFLCAASLFAGDAQWKATLVAKLADTRINESSGLALSQRTPGIFWTLNDSGGGPYIFAIDEKGETRTRCEIAGGANFDWEDIASGHDEQGKPALFIGDVGDNLLIRSQLEIYQIEEPALDSTKAPSETTVKLSRKLSAAYPDGRHNAESLLCHPKTGRLYVITKTDNGHCGVYAFPEKLQTDLCMTLESVATFDISPIARSGKRPIDNCMSTSACFSPDGRQIVLSTYSSLYEWTIDSAKTLAEAFAEKPLRIVQPLLPQCEAVCFSADGKSLWITSERLPTPLYQIELGK